jgi:hypothetical protein
VWAAKGIKECTKFICSGTLLGRRLVFLVFLSL